jgi:hypothetical protein
LRVAPEFDLQADFALAAAREIASITARSRASRQRFERGVLGALAGAYAIAMACAAFAFHAEAFAIAAALRTMATANPWWLVGLAACASVAASAFEVRTSTRR